MSMTKTARKLRIILGWMCATDFAFEMGEAKGGTEVYASQEDLTQCRPCIERCGSEKVVTVSQDDFAYLLQKAQIDPADLVMGPFGDEIWTKPTSTMR